MSRGSRISCWACGEVTASEHTPYLHKTCVESIRKLNARMGGDFVGPKLPEGWTEGPKVLIAPWPTLNQRLNNAMLEYVLFRSNRELQEDRDGERATGNPGAVGA